MVAAKSIRMLGAEWLWALSAFVYSFLHEEVAAVSFCKKEEKNVATHLTFSPPPNVCGAQQLSLQMLPPRIGTAVQDQEWRGKAQILGWLEAAGGNELFF